MFWKKKEPPPSKVAEQLGSVPWLRILMVLAALGGLAFMSTIILAAAAAAAGLAAIAVITVLGIAAFHALPLLMQKWENYLLRARKAEARKNPIEQAENDLLRRTNQYGAFKGAITAIGGQVAALKSELLKMKQDSPSSDFTAEAEAVRKMDLYYKNRLERVGKAKEALDAFERKIKEARMKWNFAIKANEAIRAMNATDQEAKMNEILTEIAFETVQQQFDEVFARIDVDAAEISGQKQMAFGGGMQLDLTAVEVPQLEPMGAR